MTLTESSASTNGAKDECNLCNVINELDKERTKCAELEDKIYQMSNITCHDDDEKNAGFIDDEGCVYRLQLMLSQYNSKASGLSQSQLFHRHLSPLLIELFTEFFDSTTANFKNKKRFESIKEKFVNEATSQVRIHFKKHMSDRLPLKKNSDDVLYPILTVAVSEFIASLKKMAQDGGEDDMRSKDTLAAQKIEKEMRSKLLRLSTERDGFLDMINAMTAENNAVALASKNFLGTLPVHIVRCLEIMPWDTHTQKYISVFEEVHEWQAFDSKRQTWTSKLKAFPSSFSSLPICDYKNIEGQSSDEKMTFIIGKNKLQRVFESFALSGDSLLTDASCNNILDLKNGYPLPTQGTWEWVGGWTLQHDPQSNDDEGWSYAADPVYHMSKLRKNCFDIPGINHSVTGGTPIRCFRRRTRRRQRVLISYPGISQMTKQMLAMNSRNARLTICVSKLSDQVVSMQNELDQKDAETVKLRSQLSSLTENAKKETDKELDLKENATISPKSPENKEPGNSSKLQMFLSPKSPENKEPGNSSKLLKLGSNKKKKDIFIDKLITMKPGIGRNPLIILGNIMNGSPTTAKLVHEGNTNFNETEVK